MSFVQSPPDRCPGAVATFLFHSGHTWHLSLGCGAPSLRTRTRFHCRRPPPRRDAGNAIVAKRERSTNEATTRNQYVNEAGRAETERSGYQVIYRIHLKGPRWIPCLVQWLVLDETFLAAEGGKDESSCWGSPAHMRQTSWLCDSTTHLFSMMISAMLRGRELQGPFCVFFLRGFIPFLPLELHILVRTSPPILPSSQQMVLSHFWISLLISAVCWCSTSRKFMIKTCGSGGSFQSLSGMMIKTPPTTKQVSTSSNFWWKVCSTPTMLLKAFFSFFLNMKPFLLGPRSMGVINNKY